MTRVLPAALLLALAASLAAPLSSLAQPPTQVHWTIVGPTSVTLSWRGPANRVRWGVSAGAYDRLTHGRAPSPYPISSPGPFWEARLTGLHPNTVYHYAIEGGQDHTFRTPPPAGLSDFVVAAEADVGDATYYPRVAGVQSLIATMAPRFAILAGDLTYANDHGQIAVDRHFDDMMVWSQDAAYMPTWGNHDWEGDSLANNYKGRFHLPHPMRSPGSPDLTGEDWYWFDYGNARFIVYPEPWAGAWADWNAKAAALMDSAQADPAIRFIVTAGHRPAFSSGHHTGSTTLRNYLNALGASHSKYVLNINGHSHNYERSHPQSGVVHLTAGGGGSTLETDPVGQCLWKGGCPPPSWVAFRAMRHGPVRLEFTATGIRGQAICGPAAPENDVSCTVGSVFDSFVIGAPDRAPVIDAPAVVTVPAGQRIQVAVTAADPEGTAVTSLTADLSELPAGHDAAFVATGPAAGTLTWTTTPADGHRTHFVTLRAANARTAAATLAIRVLGSDAAPVLRAPATYAAQEGRPVFLGVSVRDPDGDDIEAITADLSGLPAGHNAVFFTYYDQTSGTLIWTPSFEDGGRSYTVTFRGANALSGSATTAITVQHVDRFPKVITPVTASAVAGVPFVLEPTALDPDGDPIRSLTADLTAFPPGHGATFTASSGNTRGLLRWTPSTSVIGRSFNARFVATNARSSYGVTTITVRSTNAPPVAALDIGPRDGVAPHVVAASAAGSSDPEGNALSFLFDFGDGATLGPQASPLAAHAYAAGTWVARVHVSDGSSTTTSPPTVVTVAPNLVGNPSFEHGFSGWRAYSGSTITTVAGGQHGDSALRVDGPATTAAFGVNDSPNWIATTSARGARYRFTAWVRTLSSAANVRLRIREYAGATQVGLTTHSAPAPAGSGWQGLEVDHLAGGAGNTLDLQVLDTPVAGYESFEVDNVGIREVAEGAPADVPGGLLSRGLALAIAPNPIRSSGRATLVTTRQGPVSIGLYDVQGRLVRTLLERAELPAGAHGFSIDLGRGVAVGIYYIRVSAAEGTLLERIAVVH